jgi:hypothetical protein
MDRHYLMSPELRLVVRFVCASFVSSSWSLLGVRVVVLRREGCDSPSNPSEVGCLGGGRLGDGPPRPDRPYRLH